MVNHTICSQIDRTVPPMRARLQHRAGLRKDPASGTADGLAKFGSILGDARMLFRIWGGCYCIALRAWSTSVRPCIDSSIRSLPIFQWLMSLERTPPPTRKLLTIERLQGWSMIAYYPLEHLYYAVSHSLISPEIRLPSLSWFIPFVRSQPSEKRIPLDVNTLGVWSTRFWAAYVVLQLAHLREDRKLLQVRERSLSKSKATGAQAEKEELKQRWDSLWTELAVNIGYLPLTIHWYVSSVCLPEMKPFSLPLSTMDCARLSGRFFLYSSILGESRVSRPSSVRRIQVTPCYTPLIEQPLQNAHDLAPFSREVVTCLLHVGKPCCFRAGCARFLRMVRHFFHEEGDFDNVGRRSSAWKA
ncbi:hypothetical protein A0H81_08047 [Grifola frondosa]|uniref:Uncharacterized protein n=1 Tax=Grifola frondosa TaxID=5627 RepID=A0A1C7M572_GRIFR|nr:hypothetical protein A0H81_08047 [Grifola frondosa]